MNDIIFHLLFGLLVAFIWALNIIFFYKVKKKREAKVLRQLFNTLICEVKCTKCGYKGKKEWEIGDFMMKNTTFKHYATQVVEKKLLVKKKRLTLKLNRGLCTGNVIIDGIYVVRPPLTKKELKYKQLCDKWR